MKISIDFLKKEVEYAANEVKFYLETYTEEAVFQNPHGSMSSISSVSSTENPSM